MSGPVTRPHSGETRRRTAAAPAKLNLHLGVGPQRADGLHGIVTVYQSVGLWTHVTMTAEPASGSGTVAFSGPSTYVERGDEALVRAAVRRCFETSGRPEEAVRVDIDSDIPVRGGMGSGAANAAASIVAANSLFELGLSPARELEVAQTLGSDVPLCLHGGTMLGIGHGEQVSPMPWRGDPLHWVVAMAREGLGAESVFAELDRMRGAGTAHSSASFDAENQPVDDGHIELARALAGGDVDEIAANLYNDLANAVVSLRPAVRRTLEDGREAGALAAVIAGSGPTCLLLCRDGGTALDVATELATRGSAHAVRAVTGPTRGAHITAT